MEINSEAILKRMKKKFDFENEKNRIILLLKKKKNKKEKAMKLNCFFLVFLSLLKNFK